ncbi:MAG TPA: heme exporter protein CcmD [Caulobacteraceae bacterium]|jgi:heme exporter protein D
MLHLEMGKYAMYVWPAWGLSVLVLAGLVADTLMRARRAKAALDRAEKGE